MRREDTYFKRLGDELWEMSKIYCLPKHKAGLRTVIIEDGVQDAEEVEDGYLSASYMWQRAICGLQTKIIANDYRVMEMNSVLMMMTIEQQRVWEEPFRDESRKRSFKLRKPMESQR